MMLNLNSRQKNKITLVRLIQLVFLFVFLWFFFWSHIYEMVFWNKTFVESVTSSLPNVLKYSISLIIIILLQVYFTKLNKILITSDSKLTKNFYQEKENLNKMTLQKNKSTIELPLIATGAVLLIASMIFTSTIIAFIGLSLTFWGILFLLTQSNKFVQSSVFEATNVPLYSTLDRIIYDLNYDGKATYIPTPSESNLPEHLAVLKELLVFVSSKTTSNVPSLEELIQKQFMVKNPDGICFTAPGSGLVNLIKNELKTNMTNFSIDELCDQLSVIIVKNLELSNNFETKVSDETVHLKITNSVFSNLYSENENLKSVSIVGCPLVSALGCILAGVTRKFVTLTQTKVSSDLKIIEVLYKIEGRSI